MNCAKIKPELLFTPAQQGTDANSLGRRYLFLAMYFKYSSLASPSMFTSSTTTDFQSPKWLLRNGTQLMIPL